QLGIAWIVARMEIAWIEQGCGCNREPVGRHIGMEPRWIAAAFLDGDRDGLVGVGRVAAVANEVPRPTHGAIEMERFILCRDVEAFGQEVLGRVGRATGNTREEQFQSGANVAAGTCRRAGLYSGSKRSIL